VDFDNLRAVVRDLDSVHPARTRDIVKFAVDCSNHPAAVTSERCDVLRRHGLSEAEIIELLSMVSFSLYAINLAEAMKLDIDEDFRSILGGTAQDIFD
jgi:alkylhydroperoxidase family enzyme